MKETEPELRKHGFDHVARQASIRFGGLAFDKLLGYVFALLVAKTYGSTEFGLYLFGVGIFEIAFALSRLGLDRSTVREVAHAHAQGRDGEIRSISRTTLALSAPLGLGIGLAIYLVAPALAAALERPLLTSFLQLGALAVPATVVAEALLFPTEGLGLQRYIVTVQMIAEPAIKIALTVVFFVALGEQAEIGALGLAYALSIGASALLAAAVYSRVIPASSGDAPLFARAGPLLRVGLPACLLHLLSRVLAWYDIFIVFSLVSAQATTHYTVALRTAMLTTMVASAFESAFKPAVAGALALGARERVEEEYLRVSRSVLLLCLPAVVFLTAFPGHTMAVLGDQFVAASPIVAIVAAATLAIFLTGPAASALVMAGNARAPLVNGLAGGAIGIATALALVPRFGSVGAAVGQLASLVVTSGLNAIVANRQLGVVGVGRDHARLVVATAVSVGAGYAASALAPDNKYLAFFCIGSAVLGAYVATIAALGVRADDLRLIRSVLHLPSRETQSRG